MLGTAHTLSTFVTSKYEGNYGIDFTDFTGDNLQGSVSVGNTQASLIVTGSGDGKQGMVYLHQDKNKSSGTISNAQLNIGSLLGGGAMQAEFWSTGTNQNQAQHVVPADFADLATPNDSHFAIPTFSDDWMVKYYELYSTRLKTWREQGQEVIALEYKAMQNEGPVDVYVVYVFNGGPMGLMN